MHAPANLLPGFHQRRTKSVRDWSLKARRRPVRPALLPGQCAARQELSEALPPPRAESSQLSQRGKSRGKGGKGEEEDQKRKRCYPELLGAHRQLRSGRHSPRPRRRDPGRTAPPGPSPGPEAPASGPRLPPLIGGRGRCKAAGDWQR